MTTSAEPKSQKTGTPNGHDPDPHEGHAHLCEVYEAIVELAASRTTQTTER